jgi:hypothetical protein
MMKKYTLQHVLTKMRIGSATRPKPFPGKTPTHMAWIVRWSNGKKWSYVGKPSKNAYDRFVKLSRHRLTNSYLIREFDQTSVIGERIDYSPLVRDRGGFSSRDVRLAFYYKPHEPAWRILGSIPMYSQKINGRWVYSSMTKMTTDLIESYTRWVRLEGLI